MRVILSSLLILIAGCSHYSESTRNEDPDSSSKAATENLYEYSDFITEDLLHNHLSVLAHDSLEGRETGLPGQKKAANYLVEQYRTMALTPAGDSESYLQPFNLSANVTDSLVYHLYSITDEDTLLVDKFSSSGKSQSPFVKLFGGSIALSGDLVFAGFGVNDTGRGVNHLDGVDFSGKWVVIFEDIPYIIEGDTLINPSITENSRYGTLLGQKGAKGVLLIGNETEKEFSRVSEIHSRLIDKPAGLSLPYRERSPAGQFPAGIVKISPAVATSLLGYASEEELFTYKSRLTENITGFEPFNLDYHLQYTPYTDSAELTTENVIAFFEGGDPELKDEVIVLSAHYDHIGITMPDEKGDMINNGADDDGSGTVALLAIAQTLQRAAIDGFKPDRSILFLHVTGEEKGLLGSRYYSDHPLIPIDQTVANLNADMIGRSTTARAESGNTNYVFLIGGKIISSALDSLVQVANNSTVNLTLDSRYNDLNDPNQFYRRSDHWNFGRFGIPFVFYFTGVHEDYHQPSDEIEKIDFPKLARVTKLIYSSMIEIANHPERPAVDNEEFIRITSEN